MNLGEVPVTVLRSWEIWRTRYDSNVRRLPSEGSVFRPKWLNSAVSYNRHGQNGCQCSRYGHASRFA